MNIWGVIAKTLVHTQDNQSFNFSIEFLNPSFWNCCSNHKFPFSTIPKQKNITVTETIWTWSYGKSCTHHYLSFLTFPQSYNLSLSKDVFLSQPMFHFCPVLLGILSNCFAAWYEPVFCWSLSLSSCCWSLSLSSCWPKFRLVRISINNVFFKMTQIWQQIKLETSFKLALWCCAGRPDNFPLVIDRNLW